MARLDSRYYHPLGWRNKESTKRFIGLRWSTINRLLDSIFDDKFFAQKDSMRKVIGTKSQKNIFSKIARFFGILIRVPVTGIYIANDKLVI